MGKRANPFSLPIEDLGEGSLRIGNPDGSERRALITTPENCDLESIAIRLEGNFQGAAPVAPFLEMGMSEKEWSNTLNKPWFRLCDLDCRVLDLEGNEIETSELLDIANDNTELAIINASKITKLQSQLQAYKEMCEVYEKANEFYADKVNYDRDDWHDEVLICSSDHEKQGTCHVEGCSLEHFIAGRRAREARAKVAEIKKKTEDLK